MFSLVVELCQKKAFAKSLDRGLIYDVLIYSRFMYATRYSIVAMSRLGAYEFNE